MNEDLIRRLNLSAESMSSVYTNNMQDQYRVDNAEKAMDDAVVEIERLQKACVLVRAKMCTEHHGGYGWMAEFEKLAFNNGEQSE